MTQDAPAGKKGAEACYVVRYDALKLPNPAGFEKERSRFERELLEGDPMRGEKGAKGLSTWHWKQDKPHVNYLVALAAGYFHTIEDKVGTLPIAMGHGAGAESRQPLGLAVVGGLLFSQLITLYITPVFYIYMEKLQNLFRRKKKPETEAPEVHSEVVPG